MLPFKELPDHIETRLTGKYLMTVPQLNKGTAFTQHERLTFGLLGKLPHRIENIDEQVTRAYAQFSHYQTDMQKHIYLNNLHDRNQVLFYKLVTENLQEMMPLIYTPCIGDSVQQFSHEFRSARGLFINYEDKDHIEDILDNRSNPEIELAVVTDGEGVLGIGDQGIGSINIPIAKLMVYTLCAGISPLRTLPIYLDVGTNNPTHLNDPFYLGWRHPRITGEQYDDFIAKFVQAITKKFPTAFLHWEDFGRNNARRILDNYQHKICNFNDDIQGTGAVTLAAIIAAVKKTHSRLIDQRIIIFGAGTAGTGVADQICQAMQRMGLSSAEAYQRFWLVDRAGLLMQQHTDLTAGQKPYARQLTDVKGWQTNAEGIFNLAETVKQVQPTILIGCSAQGGAFTESIINMMAAHTAQPIIFPLSNPTQFAEATPTQLLQWTDGNALIATGSPFAPVDYQGKIYPIAQSNNALVFPGIGLGVLATRAKLLTDEMIWAACTTLSQLSHDALLPTLSQARDSALKIACAVAQQAIKDDLARNVIPENMTLVQYIESLMWEPKYVPLVKV